MIIYRCTNKINGKVYIGQTTKTLKHRVRMHVNSANAGSLILLHCAIRKYGLHNFDIVQIQTADSLQDLNALEIKFISFYDCLSPKGYNLKAGGNNHEWHPEMREKARKAALRRIENDGGAQLKAVLAKGREALKGKPPWNIGKKATEEAKRNQSLAHKGQIAHNRKAIVCNETRETFVSIKKAAEHYDIAHSYVYRLLKSGQKHKKTGLSFKFIDSIDL